MIHLLCSKHGLILFQLCQIMPYSPFQYISPDIKVHGANMGTTWVLSAPGGAPCSPHESCYLGPVTGGDRFLSPSVHVRACCVQLSVGFSPHPSVILNRHILSPLRPNGAEMRQCHYCDVIMSPTASQITSLTIVYSIVYLGTDQRKHQSSVSLAFVWGIHRRPVNSPHKWPVMRKMFPFDDVIMFLVINNSVTVRRIRDAKVITWTSAKLSSIRCLRKASLVFQSKFELFHWRKCIWKCCL